MRKKIIAGNWKMNTIMDEGVQLVKSILNEITPQNAEVVFIPPFPFIDAIKSSIEGISNVAIGAQNLSEFEMGAYTGEVSGKMLSSLGCKYVLIGHSERRLLFNENKEVLKLKLKQAFQNALFPIYCCGEPLNERENGDYKRFVSTQIRECLFDLTEKQLSFTTIAYEPIWAIGTGKTANPQQAQEMHACIREVLNEKFDTALVDNVTILYGGSVNASNAEELFAQKDVDGGLVGGASLKSAEFSTIIQKMENYLVS